MRRRKQNRKERRIRLTRLTALVVGVLAAALPLFLLCGASGDVAGAIQNTWTAARTQVKQVVNNVVFPVLDLVLAVLLFVKVGLTYLDYRRTGHPDFTAPAILFATLLFTLTAPAYLWQVIGL